MIAQPGAALDVDW